MLSPILDKKYGAYLRDKYKNCVEILESNYSELFAEIFEGNFELPVELQKEVLSIIELYDLMETSYLKLSAEDKQAVDEAKVIFTGFCKSEPYYTEIRDFLRALINSEQFEERPGVRVVSEDILDYPAKEPMTALYRQMLGRLEALKARAGFIGRMLTMEELVYLTEGYEDAPSMETVH